jgi:hypothetical protein
MATDAGRLIAIAFQAAKQCQKDVGKLLRDLDGYMGTEGWTRLWDNGRDAVTYGVSKSPNAEHWMAKRIYRLFKNPSVAPEIVDGINIRFFADHPAIREPLLLVGRGKYNVPSGKHVRDVAEMWDLEQAFRKWCDASIDDLGKPLSCRNVDDGRIASLSVIGVDLYSIRSLDDVKRLLARVRGESVSSEG